MTTEEVLEFLGRIKANWPYTPVDGAVKQLWLEELAGMPAEPVMSALREHVRTSKKPPCVADIRELLAARTQKTTTASEVPAHLRATPAEVKAMAESLLAKWAARWPGGERRK